MTASAAGPNHADRECSGARRQALSRREWPPKTPHVGTPGEGYACYYGNVVPVSDSAVVREFTVVIERDEDGYLVASVPTLPGCHTQARSLDELIERVKEAIRLCLEVGGAEPSEQLELVGIQRVAV